MIKPYIKKDFLPSSFVEMKVNETNRGDRRGLVLLSIIALILLPIGIKELGINKKEEVGKKLVNAGESYISKEEVFKWIEIPSKGVSGSFSEKGGKVIVRDKKILEEICEKEGFSINTIEYLGEDKYKIEVMKE
ncbi:hypothetical protein [Clostridium sp. LP20]|uniref:hypothetical protein n=1 Tax=Clostridium sp. LP20 TaxID=3418665 RepID=UPI003EE58B8C